jgi:hypothetical protein
VVAAARGDRARGDEDDDRPVVVDDAVDRSGGRDGRGRRGSDAR